MGQAVQISVVSFYYLQLLSAVELSMGRLYEHHLFCSALGLPLVARILYWSKLSDGKLHREDKVKLDNEFFF